MGRGDAVSYSFEAFGCDAVTVLPPANVGGMREPRSFASVLN
jgi:hypothetical protein